MNQKEKLQEATVLALQGKLTETIEWKRDIHDKNFEYHTDENDRYRRFDHDDDIYDHGTFYIDRQKFNVTHIISSYKNPKFNGSWNISPIKPYDDAEYHWARAYDGDKGYKIYLKSKFIETVPVSDITSDSEIEKVAQRLLELNKNIKPSISND